MTSCSATSWSILRFQGTQTLPLMTSAFSCIIHERLICLFIYETMFTIRESRAISNSNDTQQKEQQVAGNSRFSTETPLENAD